MNSYVQGLRSSTMAWIQLAPNRSARRTPDQRAAGFGARQRKSPTGGAAKGIPLNATTAGSLPVIPRRGPVSVRTGSCKEAKNGKVERTPAKQRDRHRMEAILAAIRYEAIADYRIIRRDEELPEIRCHHVRRPGVSADHLGGQNHLQVLVFPVSRCILRDRPEVIGVSQKLAGGHGAISQEPGRHHDDPIGGGVQNS